MQFFFSRSVLISKTESEVFLKSRMFSERMNYWVDEKLHVIEVASLFISLCNCNFENKDNIIKYLKSELISHPEFSSLYFLSKDNVFLNSGGYIPPEDMDLRERPWYVNAMESDKPIFTDPFLNASRDSMVVSVSSAVYDENDDFIGVMAGDIKIEGLSKVLDELKFETDESVYIYNRDLEIISNNHDNSGNINLFNEMQKYYQMSDLDLNEYESVFIPASITGQKGILYEFPIGSVNWHVIGFVPIPKFPEEMKIFILVVSIFLLVQILISLILSKYYKKKVVSPLTELENEISEIDISNISEKRVKIYNETGFSRLVEVVNNLLDNTEEYIATINEKEESIKKQNKKLKFANEHDALTGLYNRVKFHKIAHDVVENNDFVGFLIADINAMRIINDAYGNSSGDELLIKVAGLFREISIAGEVVSRTGGDDFSILITGNDRESIEDRISLYKNCAENIVHRDIPITLSFGEYIYDRSISDMSFDKIQKRAIDNLNVGKSYENQSIRGAIIHTILKTLHETNPREENHSKRVGFLSERVAQKLNLSCHDIKKLKSMALLHDIGKISIDPAILNKPDKLTQSEMKEIRRHTEIGYRLLSTVNEYSEIAESVYAHHERWDGNGYPRGIEGESIPYFARIISVVDAYDAMTSKRPYRETLSKSEALEELRKYSGLQFDPNVVKVFIDLVENCEDLI